MGGDHLWDAVGAIAELLGAVAIVVTLIYLAVQIKYARLSSIDTNRENRVVGIRELNGFLIANSEARAAWNKSMGSAQKQLINDIAESLGLDFDEASIIVLQGWLCARAAASNRCWRGFAPETRKPAARRSSIWKRASAPSARRRTRTRRRFWQIEIS